MASPRFQHTVVFSEEIEQLWRLEQERQPELSFNSYVIHLIRHAGQAPPWHPASSCS